MRKLIKSLKESRPPPQRPAVAPENHPHASTAPPSVGPEPGPSNIVSKGEICPAERRNL